MTNDTTIWTNVWAQVRSRQEALRWTDAELCKRCEISPPIYRDGRNNGRPLSHTHKIAGLEEGLDWRRGSVESILAGGEPVVVERPTDSVELRPSIDLGLRLERLEGVVRQMLKLMTSGGRQSELTLAALADQLERDRPAVEAAD